jgi:Flp pilus assembly protein TadD
MAPLLLAMTLLAQDDAIGRLRHMDPEVRRAACTIVKQCNLKPAVPYLVEYLRTEGDGAVKLAMMDALETLTGIKGKFGDDYKKWNEWWETEGRKTYPVSELTPDEVQRIVQPRIDELSMKAKEAKSDIRVLSLIVIIVAFVFVMVMIYFVGHVSSKLKEWKEVVREAGVYIEEAQRVTKRTDRVLEELEAKKNDILEFVKNLKEEKESEIERYADLLQKNTEHRMREEVMALRQKAERELQETLGQLRQQIEIEVRKVAGDQKERIDRELKVQHDGFMKEVEVQTLFLQAGFNHTQGKDEDALRLFRKLLALRPDHQIAWVKMGTVLRDLSRIDEALEAFQKAIDLDPEDASARYHMASAYARQRDREKMLEALALAVKKDGDFKDEALNDLAFREYWNDPAFKDLAEA